MAAPPLNTPDHTAWFRQRVQELEEEVRDLRSQSPTARYTQELGSQLEALQRENQELKTKLAAQQAATKPRSWGREAYNTKEEAND